MRAEPEIESILLNGLLHLMVPGKTLRMAVWQQLAALDEAGYVIVPREPTDAMGKAGEAELLANGISVIARDPVFCWRAMIAEATQK